jgi:hypothetical protein
MTSAEVAALVRDDLRALRDARVAAHISALLVAPPSPLLFVWPYGPGGETFEGFLVLDHPPSGTGIACCRDGLGPAAPCTLLFTTDLGSPPSTGRPDGRYPRFLDAYFESKAATDLAIWRIRERQPGQEPAWLSGELPWDEAWERVMALRVASPQCWYDCEHAVRY